MDAAIDMDSTQPQLNLTMDHLIKISHHLLRLIMRFETFQVLLGVFIVVIYTIWLTVRYSNATQEIILKYNTFSNRSKLRRPILIDIGFSDIPLFREGTWRWMHGNIAYYANCGQRPYMEDRMHYMNDPCNNLSIFSIFDGHGGSFVSQYLEENFSTAIRRRLLAKAHGHRLSLTGEENITEAIVTEIHNIDDAISRLNLSSTSLTGSTLISVILEQNRFLTVINVGDSRAVACDSSGLAIALSTDHKPSDANERKRIERAGGYIEKDSVERVQGILSISRAFGDTALKRLCVLTAHPDIVRVDLQDKRFRFILVASDGFWDVLSNQNAVDLAQKFLDKTPSTHWHKVAEYLTKTALSFGSEDNVSMFFLRL